MFVQRYGENLTPSQRAAADRADFLKRQKYAKAQADAENTKRRRAEEAQIKKTDETLQRLVKGDEIKTGEDLDFLINLYMNKGEVDGPELFKRGVYNFNDAAKRRAVVKAEREAVRVAMEHEQRFWDYVTMRDKRDTKKVVESFKGTAYETIAKAIYDASPKRPKKAEVEAS